MDFRILLLNLPGLLLNVQLHLIFLLLFNNVNFVSSTSVLPPSCSDHSPITATLNFKSFKKLAYKKTLLYFHNTHFEGANEFLNSIDWNSQLVGDIDNMNDVLSNKILTAIDQFVPNKTVTIRPNDKIWMTNEIRLKIRQRNRQHSRAKQNNSQASWNKFKSIRNQVITLIREAKDNYLSKLQSSLIDKTIPPGKWWRIAKSVMNLQNKSDTDSPLIINGDLKIHPLDKADSFNDYFTSISVTDKNADDLPPDYPPTSPLST